MPVFGLELPLLLVLVGLGLMITEALSPGAHLIVLGVALVLAGLVGTLVAPASGPLALAGLTLLFGAAALYVYREYDFYGSGSAGQTSDSDSLRGNTGRVVDRVTATEGRVKLDDGGFNPYYQARALDGEIPVDEEVIVVDPGGGNVLQVMSQSAVAADEIDRELRRDARREDGGEAGAEQADADGVTEAGGGDASEPSGDDASETAGNDASEAGGDDASETEDRAGARGQAADQRDVETERSGE